MRKIVLFSPTGYVGSLIKEYILQNKNMQLFEITRSSNLDEYFGVYDILIYSASVSQAEIIKSIKDNVISAITIIDFCKKHCIKRIIYLSSDSIYGELNIDEVTTDTGMVNPGIYGITKYLAEQIIIESGISYFILRMPGIVGRIWRNTYLYRLIDIIYCQEPVILYNSDKKFNNVLDIDDLMRFLMILCDCIGDKNEIFLLGNTEKVELMKLVLYIKNHYRSASEIKHISAEDKRYFTLDVSKAVEYGYVSKSIWEIVMELSLIKETKDCIEI